MDLTHKKELIYTTDEQNDVMWSVCFSNDGNILVAAAGNSLSIYSSVNIK